MKAEVFDQMFDEEQDITSFLDLTQVRHPGYKSELMTIDFPVWILHALDRESKRLGISRESVIKVWLAERLEKSTK